MMTTRNRMTVIACEIQQLFHQIDFKYDMQYFVANEKVTHYFQGLLAF